MFSLSSVKSSSENESHDFDSNNSSPMSLKEFEANEIQAYNEIKLGHTTVPSEASISDSAESDEEDYTCDKK